MSERRFTISPIEKYFHRFLRTSPGFQPGFAGVSATSVSFGFFQRAAITPCTRETHTGAREKPSDPSFPAIPCAPPVVFVTDSNAAPACAQLRRARRRRLLAVYCPRIPNYASLSFRVRARRTNYGIIVIIVIVIVRVYDRRCVRCSAYR